MHEQKQQTRQRMKEENSNEQHDGPPSSKRPFMNIPTTTSYILFISANLVLGLVVIVDYCKQTPGDYLEFSSTALLAGVVLADYLAIVFGIWGHVLEQRKSTGEMLALEAKADRAQTVANAASDILEKQRALWTLTPEQVGILETGLWPYKGEKFRICRDVANTNSESIALELAAVLILKCGWLPDGGGAGIFAIQSLKMTPGIMIAPYAPPTGSTREEMNQFAKKFADISASFEKAKIVRTKNYVTDLMSGRMSVTVPPQQAAIIGEHGVAIVPSNEMGKDATTILIGPKPTE
jgi:hypothetical protein